MALSFYCSSAIPPQHHVNVTFGSKNPLQNVKNLIKSIGITSKSCSPHLSLQQGNWVKLICGASFELIVLIVLRILCMSAVNEGIEAAREIVSVRRPWVMISVNDDDDLHFRKAEFDPENCPSDCPRPCENVCPANAISFERENLQWNSLWYQSNGKTKSGVITERCYGCGRCFPICPYDKISEVTYVRDAGATAELLKTNDVDAIEIHTSGSLPDTGDATIPAMNQMYSIMEPHLSCFNLWQLDGRPMSGDIGRGATRESIAFAVHVTASRERPPGFLQLAGGTNVHTVDYIYVPDIYLCRIQSSTFLIGGIAYGGYARKIVGRVLSSMRSQHGDSGIEHHAEHLLNALKEALHLVGPVKSYNYPFGIQQ
ncbi:putative ATP-citrate synthase [Hibiscus syriacus]|uniref:ATP-citrate synthase n=1 Tax=Hibiscus syriacus TaxID=106335 RepID=A0A6A3AFU3_HIBSY|nr:putative ATP-citrate synthase [Hibiscus syriacus]